LKKQSQFWKRTNELKPSYLKDLSNFSAFGLPKKQSQSKANFLIFLSQIGPNLHYIARTLIL